MRRTVLVCLAAAGIWACQSEQPASGSDVPESLRVNDTETSTLVTVPSEPVVGRSGPGGESFEVALRTAGETSYLQRRVGRRTFDLAFRTTGVALSEYPCSSCHQGRVVTGQREPDVHQNIRPEHPAATGTACATCHAESGVDRLQLADGTTVTLDHAYQLCAQCHFSQADAWAGGSHGKRLSGWNGPRVVMGCADCHDPHRPTVTKRIPFEGPRLPLGGAVRP